MKRLSILPSVQFSILSLSCAAINLLPLQKATAATIELTFTRLEGIVNPNSINGLGTAIYRASLPTDYDITAIKINDIIGLGGGSPGKFSGFDLDAIKISHKLITNPEDIKTLPGLNVFDFTPVGTVFTPGTQRPVGNSKFSYLFRGDYLFGTKNCGGTICVDNNVATLGNFDAFAITDTRATGFMSLGDGGQLLFNLTKTISSLKQEPLYVYAGEVADNGEQLRGRVTAFGRKRRVPEPTSLGAISLMGLYLTRRIKNKKKVG
ncbi:hypothetical protein NIES2111_42730 [Nostoc sp. NIES-2111]|nr:hypothetical protein NIES2111_42730 [Nostoc sp. NIES-2111]